MHNRSKIFLIISLLCFSLNMSACNNRTSSSSSVRENELNTSTNTATIESSLPQISNTEQTETHSLQLSTTFSNSTTHSHTTASPCKSERTTEVAVESSSEVSSEFNDTPLIFFSEAEELDAPTETNEVTLNATVLNVGQSSCTILESDGEYMVIDAADAKHKDKVIDYLDINGISNIQYLVFTHYDNDHIGAGDELVKRSDQIIGPDYKDSKKIKDKERILYTSAGDTYILGKCFIEIIAPTMLTKYNDDNDYSVSMIISDDYENRLYIGGDSSEESEHEQVNRITDNVDVYIVNQHGSRTSSNANFLYRLYPQYAIISCGKDNTYGHPHQVTLDKLNRIGCEIYRTDTLPENQNIRFSFSTEGVTFMND